MRNWTLIPVSRSSMMMLFAAGTLSLVPACQVDTSVDSINAPSEDALAVDLATEYLMASRADLRLDNNNDFQVRNFHQDEVQQTHVRYDQLYRGIPVWQGEAIVHMDRTGDMTLTDSLKRGIRVDVHPVLTPDDARMMADDDLLPIGPYVSEPKVELVVFPIMHEQVRPNRLRGPGGELNAVDVERVVVDYRLAYHVHAELENGTEETDHADFMFDAHNGELLDRWSTLMTAAATGTGNSQYSGAVSLNTNSTSSGWEMRDVARSMNYATYNLNHKTSGTGTIYSDTDNTWGDGANYISGGSTTNANGQTAGVDAHYAIGKTWDYYYNIQGRNGIDGAGTATYNRVHYSSNYINAFWSDSCFCMTYGDGGSGYGVLTSLDVGGHEMTHGVTSRTANLTYSGESGGLNESMSDIHGTMTEFYARGGSGSSINNTGGNWTVGEQLYTTPLRYMYKPSLDGASPDAWYSGIGNIDVHYSSGPMNRAFYFLSQGASNSSTSNYYSSYLPAGMTGVGNDHAARIAYRALASYMTSSTNYAGARTAFLSAAAALYGNPSTDYAAVQDAFAAINVGTSSTGGTGGGTGGGAGSELVANPSFESGAANWTQTTGVITNSSTIAAKTGTYKAWLCGYGTTHTDYVYQTLTIPSSATTATFSLWLYISTNELSSTTAYDTMKIQLRNSAGSVLTTLATYSNLNKNNAYVQKTFDVSAYKGQTVQIYFTGTEDSSRATNFVVDDVSVTYN